MRSCIHILAILLFLCGTTLWSQDDPDDYRSRQEIGFVFTMAETGSGLGGMYNFPVFKYSHVGVSLDAYFLRDSQQLDFVDYYGIPVSVNKKNNVYVFDLMLTMKRRFFAEDLDESFRPFLTAGAGPYFGMNFPEYEFDETGNPTKDQYMWTMGGFAGAGVDVSVNNNLFISVRTQYRIIPFDKILGERSNHSMFELRFEIGQQL